MCILVVTVNNIVSKTDVEISETISWEQLRRESSLLGIPAWKLAEELAFHKQPTGSKRKK